MKELQARHDYPVAVLCSALGVSRSGYYAWCERPTSARQRDDERLKVAIRGVHAASRQTYGTRRVLVELRAQGFEAGRDRVDRLRRTMALRCRQKALLGFTVAVLAYNVLALLQAVIEQAHRPALPELEVSTFHLAQHVKQGFEGLLVAVPAQCWSELAEPSPERLARRLLELAMHLPAKKLATAKRGPKVATSKGWVDGRTARSHFSTARLLKASGRSP